MLRPAVHEEQRGPRAVVAEVDADVCELDPLVGPLVEGGDFCRGGVQKD